VTRIAPVIDMARMAGGRNNAIGLMEEAASTETLGRLRHAEESSRKPLSRGGRYYGGPA
jgi:hypothetical protein